MRKPLLTAILALCLVLSVLLETAKMADTDITDFSQYLTDNLIAKEDLIICGVPFYELSIDEFVAQSPNLKNVNQNNDGQGWLTVSGSFESGESIWVHQKDEDTTISSFGFYSHGQKAKTEIRGISTTDSIDSVLRKLGVSDDGAAIIAATMLESKKNFNLITGEIGGSSYDNIWTVHEDGSSTSDNVDEPIIRFEDGKIGLTLYFKDGRLDFFEMYKLDDTDREIETPSETATPASARDEYIYDTPDPGKIWNSPLKNWMM